MKAFFLSCIAGLTMTGAAMAEGDFLPGANAFASAPLVPVFGGLSDVTNLQLYTAEPNEPVLGNFTTQRTAWWRWVAPVDGYCVVDTLAGAHDVANPLRDTLLGVFTGSSVGSLTTVAVNDDYARNLGAMPLLSSVTFYAKAGETYHFMVDGRAVDAAKNQFLLKVRPISNGKQQRAGVWADSTNQEAMGNLTVTQTGLGRMTGRFSLGGQSFSFAGGLDERGFLTLGFLPKTPAGQPPRPPVTVRIDGSLNGGYEVSYGGSRPIWGDLHFRRTGRYNKSGITNGIADFYSTTVITPMSARISPTGSVTGMVVAVDGTKVTFSSALHQEGGSEILYVPIYKTLHGGKGGLMIRGVVVAEDDGPPEFWAEDAAYLRPAKPGAIFYPDGVQQRFSCFNQVFVKLAAGERALGFLNGTAGAGTLRILDPAAELGGEKLIPLTLSEQNKFSFDAVPEKPVLKLNVTTGQVTGSIILAGKKRPLNGVLMDDGGPVLRGMLIGPTRSVRFSVAP